MNRINCIRSQSALRHRNLRKFLKESDATSEDLLTYNIIRKLSKRNSLSTLWCICQELTSFLRTCTSLNGKQSQDMMSSSKDMSDLAFLVDICGHLNDLNLKLQEKNKTTINTLPAVQAFSYKLKLFLVDVQGDMLHSPALKPFLDEDEGMAFFTNDYTHFIEKLQQDFNNGLSQFQSFKHIMQLIKTPQTAKLNGKWVTQLPLKSVDVSYLQLELCNLKGTDINKIEEDFYLQASTKAEFPQLAQL
ncbi:general transcription factor II-I repeat domain-containing protein 2-like [Watersipora subatra]|uniref:general transcription factor II-I repeat domain-containing protein 2-like n=1 Tax=Watersipora subatra TaxID=2589382 RepID=UPI00355C1EB8